LSDLSGQVQIGYPKYEFCDVEDLAVPIADIISELIQYNLSYRW